MMDRRSVFRRLFALTAAVLLASSALGQDEPIHIDPSGTGHWHDCKTISLENNKAHYALPYGFSTHWVRLISNADATISAALTYE